MVGIIIGNQNPLLGTTYSYEIKPFGLSFGSNKYEWYLYKKQKNGTWKDITGTPKTGEKVTYRFGEPGLGIEFEMKVYETKQGILPGMPSSKQLAGSIKLIPTSNKVPKIDKVVLFNRGARDVNKASYRDTLIAQAHCIGMFNKDIEFHLWEDDAPGKGHNSTINKNNRHTRTYTARVNEKGIAEIGIPLMSDERVLRQMANKLLMKGDQNEGANHEYYVTASYSGKIMGASQTNVDVANPDHKTGQQPTQPKSQPQTNTPKFPTGQGGGPRQPDPKGNIIEAVFVDSSGKELSKVAVGNKVHVRIHSKNMVGKYIQYVIWEYDMGSNDEVYRSGNIKIPADLCDTTGFVITKDIFKKGVDSLIPNDPDEKTQNYFIEIISKDLAAESKKFGVNSEGLLTVENPLSPSGVQNTPKPGAPKTTCICQEQYKDLIWGGAVSCEFRKKVIEISKRASIDPNNLMAAMAHETGGTFDPTCGTFKKKKNETTEGYVGLLQIGKDAATDLKITRTELLAMDQIKQLDYIEKYLYLPLVKGKLNTLTDFYLAVLFPVDCGKGNQPNHIVFDDSLPISYKNGKVIKNLNYWRNAGYAANPTFHKEAKEKGKTYVWEIAENIKKWYDKGKQNKVQKFSCQNAQETKPEPITTNKWHDPVDNPICTLYMQSGGGGKGTSGEHWGLFGKTRNGSNHQGLDLFAVPGSSVYACVKGIVHKVKWHSGYGNTMTIKITDKESFFNHRRDYSLLYPSNGEISQSNNFDKTKDIFLFYAHLEQVLVEEGVEVGAGKVIAKSGVSGVEKGTCAPHLHFEIFTTIYAVGMGLNYRCNPGFYIHFKAPNEQSQNELNLQKETAKTRIKNLYGKK
ncbi:M23 family metallopeptidase [Chryseobacterium joostei]|uniref:M23 family metallopeptidase n=1 Tax=Chryseobacterium joostei TaxID=112234 RepID=UPI0023F54D18|nr:M23 family metallopeptidase [Chryseobacterium joostei]